MDEIISEAEKLLISMANNEHVNRWDIFRNKKAINQILRSGQYEEQEQEVEFLIDSCQESL